MEAKNVEKFTPSYQQYEVDWPKGWKIPYHDLTWTQTYLKHYLLNMMTALCCFSSRIYLFKCITCSRRFGRGGSSTSLDFLETTEPDDENGPVQDLYSYFIGGSVRHVRPTGERESHATGFMSMCPTKDQQIQDASMLFHNRGKP